MDAALLIAVNVTYSWLQIPEHGGRAVAQRPDTQLEYDIDAVNEIIAKRLPIPVRDFAFDLGLIRSFDVNKPGAEVHEL
ncbi:uncharacterized protein HD556DRAFT_1440431 [Suillus plorans]|uniref:Uncharacterized protein n=1 Tax=Suillus plorans TaxID=116603 RepID=A0A9P7DLX1_9AGAM|nr:uncharacterized protein HD556DRAFT_1440431 [Suillus plorans]KAG1798096.1 hypothetical protein HD556DRAFT_1440431 [Suillus plorans]